MILHQKYSNFYVTILLMQNHQKLKKKKRRDYSCANLQKDSTWFYLHDVFKLTKKSKILRFCNENFLITIFLLILFSFIFSNQKYLFPWRTKLYDRIFNKLFLISLKIFFRNSGNCKCDKNRSLSWRIADFVSLLKNMYTSFCFF